MTDLEAQARIEKPMSRVLSDLLLAIEFIPKADRVNAAQKILDSEARRVRAEALLQAAAVARAKGYKHAETVDKSHARRLVRRGAEAIVVALDALAAEAEPAP